MKVGRQDNAFSAICESDTHSINVRGKELARDLIGTVSFTDHFHLLVTGRMPERAERVMLDAVLVAISEHGLVPSNVAARMTLAAAPDAMQGAVAAGILGCGSVVLGASESAGRFLASILALAKERGVTTAVAAREMLGELRAGRKPVPGYGHSQHKEGDPRALRLLELARSEGIAGRHCALLEEVGSILPEIYSRPLPINVSGAIPAVMLDAGFPIGGLKGIPILARTASLIAHLCEEAERPIGFIMAGAGAEAITYDGSPLQKS